MLVTSQPEGDIVDQAVGEEDEVDEEDEETNALSAQAEKNPVLEQNGEIEETQKSK